MYNDIEKAILDLNQNTKILPSNIMSNKCWPKNYDNDMFMVQQLAPMGVNDMMNEMQMGLGMGMCNNVMPLTMSEPMVSPYMMQPQVPKCMIELYNAYPYLKPNLAQ